MPLPRARKRKPIWTIRSWDRGCGNARGLSPPCRIVPSTEILGYPDDLKFRSSMTLFASVAADNKDFTDALDKFYGGKADPATLERL